MKKIFLAVLALSLTATTVSAQDYFKTLAKIQNDKTESWETIPQEALEARLSGKLQETEDMSVEKKAVYDFVRKLTLMASKECYEEDMPAIKKALKGYDQLMLQELQEMLTEQGFGMELNIYAKSKNKKIREMVMVVDLSSFDGPIAIADMMFADGVSEEDLEQLMKAMMKR